MSVKAQVGAACLALGLWAGATYPVCAAPGDLLAVLKHPDPGPYSGYARFGTRLAVSGNQILVGAPQSSLVEDGTEVPFVGTAYLFDGITGELLYEIPNPDPRRDASFANGVTAQGGRFFLSIDGVFLPETKPDKIYAFEASSADPLVPLVEIPYSGPNRRGHVSFGEPMAPLGNDRIVAAAPSEAVVIGPFPEGVLYVLDAQTGETLLRIEHPNPTLPGSTMGQGYGVATIGNKIIAGSFLHDPFGDSEVTPGAAFVFDGTTGELLFRLDNPSPSTINTPPINDWFGYSVGTTRDKIVVGAMLEDSGGVEDSGAVHVFDAIDGSFLFTIANPEPDADEDFGRTVAGAGHHILVGAWRDDVNGIRDMGSAYLFDGDTGELLLEIPNPDDEQAAFGHTLTSMGNNLVISAPLTKIDGYRAGAVYIYEGMVDPIPGDTDRDQDIDAADFTTLLLNWTGPLMAGAGDRLSIHGDFDFDRDTDSADLTTAVIHWTGELNSAPVLAVPEPNGLCLAGLFLLLAHASRRKRDVRKRAA